MIRNVISTNAHTDVDEEYAEQVKALLNASTPDRKTIQKDGQDEIGVSITLHSYAAPGTGEPRWAVDYFDNDSRELEEHSTEKSADERYVELVRACGENLGYDREGLQIRFDTTDVDQVPGPLPELPVIDTGTVRTLLDEVSEDPVLYVERTDDGEGDDVDLAFGPSAYVPHTAVLLTRQDILEVIEANDEDKRATSNDLTDEDLLFVESLAGEADERVRAAVDVLFTVPVTS